jgi:hypothetical protein
MLTEKWLIRINPALIAGKKKGKLRNRIFGKNKEN